MYERGIKLNIDMKKYKSFLTSIKEVYHQESNGEYRSLASQARAVLLKEFTPFKHGVESGVKSRPDKFTTGLKDTPVTNTVEVDPSDQITAGTYRTKHFEMNPQAQFLFAHLPRDPRMDYDSIEGLAIEMDKLFGIHKSAATNDHATDEEVSLATELTKKIHHLARNVNLHKNVEFVNDTLRLIIGLNKNTPGVIKKARPVIMTKERPDKDVDNTEFAVSRANKAQRKLKIIDDD